MSSKEFQHLIDILQIPSAKRRKPTSEKSQASSVKSLNEQKRKAVKQKSSNDNEISVLRMPSDHVNFRAVHENN